VAVLSANSIRGLGFNLIEEVVLEHSDRLDDESFAQLQRIVADVNWSKSVTLASERESVKDIIQRAWSDDGEGDGRITAVGIELLYFMNSSYFQSGVGETQWYDNSVLRSLRAPVSLFQMPSRREIEKLTDEVYEKLEPFVGTALWEEQDFGIRDYLDQKDPTGFLTGFFGFSEHLKQSRELKMARQDAVLFALALHRYQRVKGDWPEDFTDLKGEWIKRRPIDRLSGKLLSFTIRDGMPIVYSLGHDADDDGGNAKELSDTAWLDQTSDGDWILWPTNE
jgi:hypothetical protein